MFVSMEEGQYTAVALLCIAVNMMFVSLNICTNSEYRTVTDGQVL